MRLKIFESGKYPQGDFPPQAVEAMVAAYDPEGGIEAPCVIGHLDNALAERLENELADGWVESLSLRRFGAGEKVEAWADCCISENLKDLIANNRIKYVSAEIARQEEGGLYLVRLAFLGRSIPAVSTARVPAAFRRIGTKLGLGSEGQNSDDSLLRFCCRIEKAGERQKEPNGNDNSVEVNMEKITEEQFSAEVAKAAKFEREAEAVKSELDKFRQEQEKKDVEARLAKLRDEGRLPPAEFDNTVGLALMLEGEHRDTYFRQLAGRPPVLGLGSQHRAYSADVAEGPQKSALAKLKSLAAEEKLSFSEALDRIKATNFSLYNQLEEENKI